MLILSFLIPLIVALFVFWLMYRADKKRAVPYPIITASLRSLVVFLTLLLLFSPKINKHNTELQKPIILLLQDNSQSIKKALGTEQIEYGQKLRALNNKLSKDYRLITWNLNGACNKDSLNEYTANSTNLAQAIGEATELYGQQNLSAIVLASDGWYNEGNNPLYTDIPINGSLYSIALGDTAIVQDIRISKVYANKNTSLNSQWELRADILANRCKGIRQNINLSDAQGNIIASTPININSDRFDASISFSIKATKAGLQQYKISTAKVGNEENISNNSTNVFVEVMEEKKKILLLAAAPHPDIKAISEALKGLEQYELVIKMVNEAPNNFNEYACIILHQLPSNNSNIPEHLLRNKSIWYIAGVQNNYFQLNSLQKAINFGANSTARSAEPQYNKDFNSFSLPSNIAAIADILPPLSVCASNTAAQANAPVLFKEATEKPLWAILPGATPTAVLCGEGLWRWRIYEYKNSKQSTVVDECIRQTINFLTANHNQKPFRTEMIKSVWNNPEHVHINAFLYNVNNELINQAEASISIKDSAGNTKNFSFERNATSYHINLGALPIGSYSYLAQTTLDGKALNDQGRFVVTASSLEDQESGCNYELMYALAHKNNGSTFKLNTMASLYDSIAHNNAIRPILNEQIEATNIIEWKWIFFLILLVATAEWLLRKYWMAM
jgi:hypothetical protein